MLAGTLNVPWAVGSGKFATPCERMHCANCTSLAEPEGLALPAPAPVGAEAELPAEPPQAATARAVTTTAARRGPALPTRRSPTGIFPPWITFIFPFLSTEHGQPTAHQPGGRLTSQEDGSPVTVGAST